MSHACDVRIERVAQHCVDLRKWADGYLTFLYGHSLQDLLLNLPNGWTDFYLHRLLLTCLLTHLLANFALVPQVDPHLKTIENPAPCLLRMKIIFWWHFTRGFILNQCHCVDETIHVHIKGMNVSLCFQHFCFHSSMFRDPVNKRRGNKATQGSCGESTDGAAQLNVSVWYKSYSMQKHSPLVFSPLSSPFVT